MHNRFNAPFTTKYHGLRYRKGDAIQLVSGYRGIDDPVWCESVEMIEPGIFVSPAPSIPTSTSRLLRSRVPAMQPVGRGDDRGYSVAYLGVRCRELSLYGSDDDFLRRLDGL